MIDSNLSWTAGNGMKIELFARKYCGRAIAAARINGKIESGELGRPNKAAPTQIVAMIGRVGLTLDRLEAVKAAVAELQAQIDAEAGRPDLALIQARELLTDRISGLHSAAADAVSRELEAISRDGYAGAHKAPDRSSEIAAAEQAVADFDSAHPEVATHLKTERARQAAAFALSN